MSPGAKREEGGTCFPSDESSPDQQETLRGTFQVFQPRGVQVGVGEIRGLKRTHYRINILAWLREFTAPVTELARHEDSRFPGPPSALLTWKAALLRPWLTGAVGLSSMLTSGPLGSEFFPCSDLDILCLRVNTASAAASVWKPFQ